MTRPHRYSAILGNLCFYHPVDNLPSHKVFLKFDRARLYVPHHTRLRPQILHNIENELGCRTNGQIFYLRLEILKVGGRVPRVTNVIAPLVLERILDLQVHHSAYQIRRVDMSQTCPCTTTRTKGWQLRHLCLEKRNGRLGARSCDKEHSQARRRRGRCKVISDQDAPEMTSLVTSVDSVGKYACMSVVRQWQLWQIPQFALCFSLDLYNLMNTTSSPSPRFVLVDSLTGANPLEGSTRVCLLLRTNESGSCNDFDIGKRQKARNATRISLTHTIGTKPSAWDEKESRVAAMIHAGVRFPAFNTFPAFNRDMALREGGFQSAQTSSSCIPH